MEFAHYVTKIRSALAARYGCVAYHLSTHHVQLKGEEAVWSGDVERLSMQACSVAEECYAWGVAQVDGTLYVVTVLRRDRVTSPEKAVLSYLLRHEEAYGPQSQSAEK